MEEVLTDKGHWWTLGAIKNGTTKDIMVCQGDTHSFRRSIARSSRILNSPLSLLFLEQPLLFFTSHAIHFFLRQLGQTLLVSQIFAGVLLGPTLYIKPRTFQMLVPPVALYTLQTVSRFGFILYLFLVGVKTDISVLKRTTSTAVTLAFSGFFLSVVLGFATFHCVAANLQESTRHTTPYLIMLNSVTFFIVTSSDVFSLEISNTELGRLASCVALVLDASAMFMDTFGMKSFMQEMHSYRYQGEVKAGPVEYVISVFVYYAVLFFGCRPLMIFIIQQTPVGKQMKQSHLMLILIIFLAAVFVSESINQPVSAYLLGLSLPNAPFGPILADKLEGIVTGLFLPLLCAITGLRANFRVLTSKAIWLELVFLMCYVGKFIGTIVASMLFKLTFSEALALALIVCSKGLMEIATLLLWKDGRILNNEQYSVQILHILIVTKLALPLARRLYDPTEGYRTTYSRRTIEESFENNNIRILVCIFGEEYIPSILNLLEASKPSKRNPLTIIALHLVKLTGSSMPFREPIHLVHKSIVRQVLSKHTLNAFNFMEKRNHGYTRVQHFMATAPYKTMYTDICTLAHEKGTGFIIVPFHKRWNLSEGNEELCSAPIREVNKRVLDEAPCAVGVFVDRAKISKTCWATNRDGIYRVAMLFIGGPDDHEALTYCRLLANHPRVRLTMVWMRERYDATNNQFRLQSEDDEDDVRFIMDFQYSMRDNSRVMFTEEYVSDGMETTRVAIQLGDVDLVIIGRWHDPYSQVTAGFTDWSEYAELGTLGDMLAGPEFRFSVLVIQRQPMIAWIADSEP